MSISIQIRNFGPIERAAIRLRPLTILIGPNNAGKSVAAMLTYAVMQAVSPGEVARHVAYARPHWPTKRDAGPIASDFGEVLGALKKPGPLPRLRARTIAVVRSVIEQAMEQFVASLEMQIERCFSTHFETMARATRRATHPPLVTVSDEHAGWSASVTVDGSQVMRSWRQGPSPTRLVHEVLRDLPEHVRALRLRAGSDTEQLFVAHIYRLLRERVFATFPSESYYLPAERSGILQSHRALASFVIRQAPFVGIEELQVPRMSGVVSDFISNLLQIDKDQEARFASVASDLEHAVLGGQISIKPDATGYPDVSYRSGLADFPLHRSSSMVSEVAPIVLYLRYLLDPGEYLIIEEPESHLHPRSQVALARAVSKMVGGGLNVLLTTHSDYLLNQLNNSIKSSIVQDPTEGAALAFGDVGAYLFSRKGSGTRVQDVEVSSSEGVSDSEFVRVAEDLYEETVRLEEEIGS